MTLFAPYGASTAIDVTQATQAVALPTMPSGIPAIALVSKSSAIGNCYVKLGIAGVTVTADDGLRIQPGTPETPFILGIPSSETHIAILCDGTPGRVMLTAGSISDVTSGNVAGPGSSIDNAVVRFDGATGTLVQNSGVIVDDSNNVSGVATLASGAHAGTSTSASALVVGRQGATDPVLKIDASAASVATGVAITGAAAGSRVAIAAISSGANEGLSIDAKGSGTIRLGATSTGNVELSRTLVPTADGGAGLGISARQFTGLSLVAGGVVRWGGTDSVYASGGGFVFSSGSVYFTAPSGGSSSSVVFNTPGASQATGFVFQDNGGSKWLLFKQTDQTLVLYDQVNSVSSCIVTPGSAAAGNFNIGYTTASTSSTTGALVVGGGVGLAGALNGGSTASFAGAVTALNATSIPAGGTAGSGIKFSSTSNFGVFFGSGAPTLAAAKGSLYLRSDGSATNNRAYINTDGSTTWTAVTTAA